MHEEAEQAAPAQNLGVRVLYTVHPLPVVAPEQGLGAQPTGNDLRADCIEIVITGNPAHSLHMVDDREDTQVY